VNQSTDPWAPRARQRATEPGLGFGTTRPPVAVVLSVLLALAIIAVAAAAMLPRSNSTTFDPTGAAGAAPVAAAKAALGLSG
jgi:hypothetical protein